ncbi:hypothetical protein EHS86_14695 [Erwinia amylovora]|uniref:Uncharacterized protein n=3 Tax=Erwinia amylovora TaxID=552 RepID=A0A831EIA5_ERWAM|nr:hypothetical protein AD997_00230 [Erwinia amylovora]EKV55669.1 hypothetical protein EaACW_0046 [Erwinia amylovora ACW56400]CBA18986.1 hypothetical protein predicted by Glimmer/Critica [Erwinia amylovora CFBP1430]CBX78867.1 hypothetical protein predicted by Glimmer/Critica [Erwinia amylovora ATCC BAA-2158]CCO76894.1 hypothetical protein BN432_0046 [Erwinia amylovora Ea356]CCO80673.1 hypothetical protein BN433_0051 [Erwinia amylovora Ea266]CCO84485.1 hypothetical protein BN434_0046 [Erwinia 
MSKTLPKNFIVSIPMNFGNGLLCPIYRGISTCNDERAKIIRPRVIYPRNMLIFLWETPDSG